MKPLAGIVVIDLTRVLAGPYTTMILHNLGAEILKIERPGLGDDARGFGPFHEGESAYFGTVNAGKQSMTLDLKTAQGKEILRALVAKADVLVENFVPGVMDKLELGYEALRALNPRLIYASASGFGHTGPMSRRPAYDMIVQAAGGVMSITGSPEPGAPPVRVGTSIGDIGAALFTAIGISTALFHRTVTGLGQRIDVGMLDCQVAMLENAIARYEIAGKPPRPLGTAHPSIAPFQAFPTSDSWLIVAAGNDKMWQSLCQAMEREDLLERREFKTNDDRTEHRAELVAELTRTFKLKTTRQWYDLLETAHVPATTINTIDEVLSLPQVEARNMVVETSFSDGKKLRIPGNPIKMSSFADETRAPPYLRLGADTEQILSTRLGMSQEQIEELRTQKVI